MIALLDDLRCARRRLRPLAALLGVAACVAWAHTGMAVDHVPADGAAAVICLAVMQTGAVLLTGLALAGGLIDRRPPRALLALGRSGHAESEIGIRPSRARDVTGLLALSFDGAEPREESVRGLCSQYFDQGEAE